MGTRCLKKKQKKTKMNDREDYPNALRGSAIVLFFLERVGRQADKQAGKQAGM